MHARRDGKGRKATNIAETRRDTTTKDDEGRRGSRTAALNAVPSDRQHRLLRGTSVRSGSSSLYARFKHRHARTASFFLPVPHFSVSLSLLFFTQSHTFLSLSLILLLSAWRGRGSRDDDEGKAEPPRVENACSEPRLACVGGRVCRTQAYLRTCVSARCAAPLACSPRCVYVVEERRLPSPDLDARQSVCDRDVDLSATHRTASSVDCLSTRHNRRSIKRGHGRGSGSLPQCKRRMPRDAFGTRRCTEHRRDATRGAGFFSRGTR